MNHLTIENRKGKLKLNDGVYKESADKLIDELEKLYGPSAVAAKMVIGEAVCSAENALEAVEVEINSPGGSVFEGHRIYNALRGMSARGVEITTTVNGVAASMGSVILMAGDKRQMTHLSRVMIHEASTIAWGDARTMRKQADLLEGISAEIAGIYAERTGGDPSAIRQLMFAETWMTADQAKENGFVDTVIKDGKAEFDTEQSAMSILAKLFPGNDQVAQLEAQIAENDTLRAELTNAQTKIAELSGHAESIVKLQASLDDLTARLADAEKLTNEQAERIAELEAANTVSAEKIAQKAAELLASAGHPGAVNIEVGSEFRSILEIFNSLTGAEAAAFYKANKKEITAALKNQ